MPLVFRSPVIGRALTARVRFASGNGPGRIAPRIQRVMAVTATTGFLAACGMLGSDEAKIDRQYGVSASPQIVEKKQAVPRGGGVYKVGRPYRIAGNWYYPREDVNYDAIGTASWYGDDFHGRQTANGEVFDMNALSAAHPTLPMPTYARVTNLENGRSIVVRVNDRGPFAKGREIDLSREAAQTLGMKHQGTAKVRVQYVGRARLEGSDDRWLRTTYVDSGATGNEPLTQLAAASQSQTGPAQSEETALALALGPEVRPVQTQAIRPVASQPFPSPVAQAVAQPVLAAQPGQPTSLVTAPAPAAQPTARLPVFGWWPFQPDFATRPALPIPSATTTGSVDTTVSAATLAPGETITTPTSGFTESIYGGDARIDAAFAAIDQHAAETRAADLHLPTPFDPAAPTNSR